MGESVPGSKTEADRAGATGAAKPDANGAGSAGRPEERAAAKFLADLRARGEAVESDGRSKGERDERKPLPPGVTHEIVPGSDGEPPTVRRRRYSAF